MGHANAIAASETGAPAAIAGRMADERTLVLTFDRVLAGAGDALALPKEAFGLSGQSGGVAEAYAEDRDVFVVLEQTAAGDYVDVAVAANTVFGAGIVAGSGNAELASYRIVTESGALKLKNELDPEGSGFALADAVTYMNRLKAARGDANIAGQAGLDGTDVRFLLSLLDLGLPDRTRLQAAIAQADAMLAATQGRTDAERSQLGASREHALTVAASASSTQRVLDAARVRIEASLAAFKPVGAKYRTVPAPLSVGLTPGSLLADGLFSEADRQKLGTDEGAAGASLRVALPGAKGGFDDYRPGDTIVLTVGETSYTYTLKASDVARMKRTAEADSFDFDVASFLEEQQADLAAISYSALVRNGANASQSSAAVSSPSNETFGIDVAPIILTAPDRVVQGEPIEVTVNDPQAKVYLTKRGMANDVAFDCSVADGCSLPTALLEAGSYEIHAKDASGQASASRKVEIAAKSAPLPPVAVALSAEFPLNEEGLYVFNRPAREELDWSEAPVTVDVELPGNHGAETDYELGDRVVVDIRGGEGNFESFVHELNGDEIGALNRAASEETVTISVDITSYLLGEKLLDDTVKIAAYMQDGEVLTAMSASVEVERAIWIDQSRPKLMVSTGDVIGQPPASKIPLDGGRIVAWSSENGAIYVIPAYFVEVVRTVAQLDDIVSREWGRKQAFTGANVTFPASSLGPGLFVVVSVDEAGNLSLPESAIKIEDLTAPELTVKTSASGEQAAAIPLDGGRIWAGSTESGAIYAVLANQVPAAVSAAALDDLVTRGKGLKRPFTEADVRFEAEQLGVGEYVLFAVDGNENVSAPSQSIAIRDTTAPWLTVTTSEDPEGGQAETISQEAAITAISTEAGAIYAVLAGKVTLGVDAEKLAALVADGFGQKRAFTATDVVFEAGELGIGDYALFAVDQAGNVSASVAIAIRDLTAPTVTVTTSEDEPGDPAEVIPQEGGTIAARSTEFGDIYVIPWDYVESARTVDDLDSLVERELGRKQPFTGADATFSASDLGAGKFLVLAADAAGNVSVPSNPIEVKDMAAPTLTVWTSEDGEGGVAEVISQGGVIKANSSEAGMIYAVLADQVTNRTAEALEKLVADSHGTKRPFREGEVAFNARELNLDRYVLFAVDEAGNVSEPSSAIAIQDLTAPTVTVATSADGKLTTTIPLEGGLIWASSSEAGFIYVIPHSYVESARTKEKLESLVLQGHGRKEPYSDADAVFEASDLGIGSFVVLAVDDAGNVSVPSSAIAVQDLTAPTVTVATSEDGKLTATIPFEGGRIWASSSEAGFIYVIPHSYVESARTKEKLESLVLQGHGRKEPYSDAD
ncbi:fibronectin type III domain-containing protein, partial [Paenibacillus xanthanilyticus]